MEEDYPQLDDAMMLSLVTEYEENENRPSIDDNPNLPPVPLPPKGSADVVLPEIEELGALPFRAPLEDIPFPSEEPQEKPIEEPLVPMEVLQAKDEHEKIGVTDINKEDVNNLALLENIFDKRITDNDVDRQMAVETRNDSGRLLDKEDVEVKTELNDAEILTISKLRFVADRYGIPVLRDFTDNLMTLKISRNRKGRTEFIQGLHADERREQPNEGWFSKVFGGRG